MAWNALVGRGDAPSGTTPWGHNRGVRGQWTSTEDRDVTGRRAEALFEGGVIGILRPPGSAGTNVS